ncbi:hypothetical protein ACP4OV_013913 [Aristida adscensionis]
MFYHGSDVPSPASLRCVTVAKCDGDLRLDATAVPSLRSFRYSGEFPDSSFILPRDAALTDLYICIGDHTLGYLRSCTDDFKKALQVDLYGLNVLTICSNALRLLNCPC